MRQLIFMTTGLAMLVQLALPAAAQGGEKSLPVRDPTQPLDMHEAPPAATTGALSLNAVIVKPGSMVAFINGQAVKPGDTVNGIKITRIEPDRVFYNGEQSGVLLLYPDVIKNRRSRESEQ